MILTVHTRIAAVVLLTVFMLAASACNDKGDGNASDLAPGADIHQPGEDGDLTGDVPAELGGEGFEAIAEAEGFTTNSITPEELALLTGDNVTKGGELRRVITRFLLSFRPFYYGKNASFTENKILSDFCYERLLYVHPITLELVPSLATHWKISEDSLTYTFRINPKARFANGLPVTARDVVATWNLTTDPDLESPSLRMTYLDYEEPVALSKYIVQVKSKENRWRAIIAFGASMDILCADEIELLTGNEFIEKFHTQMPVGTGPYEVLQENIVNQESYSFTRRKDYWNWDDPFMQKTFNFDKVTFEVVKDNVSLEYEKFKKGEQDFFYFTSGTIEQWVHDNEYEAIQKGWVKKMRVETAGPAGTWSYHLNMRKPPFDDKLIRQAFAHLNPRTQYINKVLYDEYEHQDSFYGNSPYENPDNPKVRFDPERAAKLLAEAGWKERNSDGFLVKDGRPFEVDLGIVTAVDKFVTPFQQELKNAGINLKIKFQDGNTLTKMANERNFTMHWGLFGGLVFPNPRTSMHSSLADKPQNTNLSGFANPTVDSLIELYDITYEASKRIELIREIDKIAMESYMKVMLYNTKGIKIGYWNKFGMPDRSPYPRFCQSGENTLYAMQYWWIDKEKEAKLNEAMKTGASIGSYDGFKVYDFWRNVYAN